MTNEQDNSIETELNIEHKMLEQNGYNIHYYTSGDETNEMLVFLHPAFGDHRCFEKQLNNFSSKYRVITIDLMGHGLSQIIKSKDKIDKSSEHIRLIIEKENYDKAHIVGVSMGSLVAQYFALQYPDKVNSLTILGGYDINADNKEVTKAQRSENIKWIFKALFSMESFRKYLASVTAINQDSQEKFYEMTKAYTRKSFRVMSGLGKNSKKRVNIKREYPLLILCGDYDIDLSKKMAKLFHENEQNSEFHMIKNAGHLANMDNDMEFNNILIDFLANANTIYL